MIDRVLEEEISELQGILILWNKICVCVKESRKSPGIAEGQERAFLDLRNEIIGRYPTLIERLEIAASEGDAMRHFLDRFSSLAPIRTISQMQWRRIEEEIGTLDAGLQRLQGVLQSRTEAIAQSSGARLLARRVFLSWIFKLLYLVCGIVIFLIVLGRILR
ncbi:MAG: hypothetical protein NTZ78_12230 [Candidatus Aureabacteria bacterium]|nr:hypothetical protein [Candidatus Auribacterota bacterium]